MSIAIIGGTGFVGQHLADALVARGKTVRAIARQRPPVFAEGPGLRFQQGDVVEPASIRRALEGARTVVYSVGLLREDPSEGQSFEAVQLRGVENALAAARQVGVQRFILISAIGVRADGTPYQSTKYRAEQRVRESGLSYSIMRPSVIFGDSDRSQEFSWQLYRDIVRPPLPAPEFLAQWMPRRQNVVMSPVAVQDVVDAIIRQIEDPFENEDVFELGGSEALTWRQMLERIAAATGRNKLFVPVPIKLMMLPAKLFGRFSFFPVTPDQLRMLEEGNVAPPDTLRKLIDRDPSPFQPDNLGYLRDTIH